MTMLHQLLTSPFVEAWVLALVHSLWVGLLCAIALWGILKSLPASRPRLRYGLACGALATFVIFVLVICSILRLSADSPAEVHLSERVERGGRSEVTAAAADGASVASAVQPPTTAIREVPATSAELPPWNAYRLPILALAWFLGCLLMLFRMSRDLAAARSLADAVQLTDPGLTAQLKSLCRRMGVRWSVQLKQTERLATVAVWGIWKPVILVPAGLVSNLRPDEVEAILAHELAHVRRWDLAFDLVQRLIEAVFFFNPAVWWISQQIRLEREACCDAAATALIRESVRYAAILVEIAERIGPPIPQPSTLLTMTGNSSGHLLDRVRRLLEPQSRPEMRLSWGTCLVLILVVGIGLALLQRGTDVAVSLAARILSDEERVERLVAEAERSGAVAERPDFEQVVISGDVEFGPGVSPTSRIHLSASVRRLDGGGLAKGLGEIKDKTFESTLPVGRIWLFLRGEGFAPEVIGPFEPKDGPVIENQRVLLSQGIEVPVEVVDADGNPAAGVHVSTTIMKEKIGFGGGSTVTDDDGRGLLRDINANLEYNLTLSGAGYQESRSFAGRLRIDEPVKLSVQRSTPTSGTIVNDDGEPLEGVVVRNFMTQQPGSISDFGPQGDILARSDASGNFTLDRLEDGVTYHLLLEHDEFAPAMLTNVRAGGDRLQATLHRGITVEVIVKDQTSELEDSLPVRWRQSPVMLGSGTETSREIYGQVTANRRDGILMAQIPRISPGRLTLTVNGQSQSFDVTARNPQILFDYSGPPARETRQVVISFHVDGEPVQPRGRLEVYGLTQTASRPSQRHQWIPVEEGRMSLEIEPPSRVRAEPRGLIGFWFFSNEVKWPEIPPGETDMEIAIPVRPAGAVQGRALRSDGSPAANIDVNVTTRLEIPSEESHDGRAHSYTSGQSVKTDADGRYFVTPVPLGAKYAIAVSEDFYRQVSEEFIMSEDDVSPSHLITMSSKSSLTGQVLDPNGEPARSFPVSLHNVFPLSEQRWGPPQLTNADGRFTFDGVNSQPSGKYVIAIDNQLGIQPITVPLEIGKVNVIHLKRGLTLSGQALDPDGNPVPGVEVYARFPDHSPSANLPPFINADEVTDARGRFRFTTLPDLPTVLGARQLWQNNEPKVRPGQSDEVIIRGKVAPWHAEKVNASPSER